MVKHRSDPSALAIKAEAMDMAELHHALVNEIAAYCILEFEFHGGGAIPGARRKAERTVRRLRLLLEGYLRRAGFPKRVVAGHPALTQLAGLAGSLEQRRKLTEVKAWHRRARECMHPILDFLEPRLERK